MKTFYANGKLLITGEYLVLKGATALAVPLNKGQSLSVLSTKKQGLTWQANNPSGLWFEAYFDEKLTIIKSSDHQKAKALQLLLQKAVEQNRKILNQLNYSKITTQLDFDPNWGWGSSSTLLQLLEQWLQINPYQLMDETIGGSGYDIACAGTKEPILYNRVIGQQPKIRPVHFKPPFIQHMGIVYLNKKQNSSTQVKSFLAKSQQHQKLVNEISILSEKIAVEQNIDNFMNLINQHESIIAKAIESKPIHQQLFPKFNGAIKSLGAWGGDFALFVSIEDFSTSKKWLIEKGYTVVMPFREVIF